MAKNYCASFSIACYHLKRFHTSMLLHRMSALSRKFFHPHENGEVLPGLSDQRPSLIVAHGLLFGSFLLNRSPWASIWRHHCYDVLEGNCQIKAHGPVFRKPWYWRYVAKWSIKNYCWQDNCNSSC